MSRVAPRRLARREIVGRRRRLAHARRHFEAFEAFEAANRYQAELKGTALAMIGYLEGRWRIPGWPAEVDRWWRIVNRYACVLDSGVLEGRGARERLRRVLDENQQRPSDLEEQWLGSFGRRRRISRKRPGSVRGGRI